MLTVGFPKTKGRGWYGYEGWYIGDDVTPLIGELGK